MGLYRWDQDRHDLLHLALSVEESIASCKCLSLYEMSLLEQSLHVPENDWRRAAQYSGAEMASRGGRKW